MDKSMGRCTFQSKYEVTKQVGQAIFSVIKPFYSVKFSLPLFFTNLILAYYLTYTVPFKMTNLILDEYNSTPLNDYYFCIQRKTQYKPSIYEVSERVNFTGHWRP